MDKACWRTSIRGAAALIAFASLSGLAAAQAAPQDGKAALAALACRFAAAQTAFDAEALAAMTAPDYIEISPVGEVDPRDKMLAFYSPEKKTAAPVLRCGDTIVRQYDDVGIVIAKNSFEVQLPDGNKRNFDMRVSYVAQRAAGAWQLVSAQYTGIRPPRPPAK